MIVEVWKDIKGYEGLYQVSNLGNIKGYKRQGTNGNILKPNIRKDGYLQVYLLKSKKYQMKLVHRLVAEAFIPNSENKPQVNHIDGNKLNNNVNNLEWISASDNCIHRHYILDKNVKKVLCVETGVIYPSIREAERQMKIGSKEILNCCKKRKRYKTAGGYHWEYVGVSNE